MGIIISLNKAICGVWILRSEVMWLKLLRPEQAEANPGSRILLSEVKCTLLS